MMRLLREERGFTLPEVLVTMVLLGIVTAAFGQLLITSSKTSNRVEEQSALQSDVRASIDRLTTDLREATNTHGTSAVEAATPTSLTFDAPDRSTPFHLRRITYQLVGGQLQRNSVLSTDTDGWPWVWPVAPVTWSPELDSITNGGIFSYLDTNGAPTTDPSAVRTVRVTMTVGPRQSQGGSSTYTALVTIRTLQ